MNPLTPILCIAMACCFIVVMTLLLILRRVIIHFIEKSENENP